MYANVNAYAMRMPAHYVDMSADEIEYDGSGWFGALFGAVAAVNAVATVLGAYTVVDDDND